MKKIIELLSSGWNKAANHEKMTFEETTALHEAISILSKLDTKDEFNKKMIAYIEYNKTKLDGTVLANCFDQKDLQLFWQIQFYRQYLSDILPD